MTLWGGVKNVETLTWDLLYGIVPLCLMLLLAAFAPVLPFVAVHWALPFRKLAMACCIAVAGVSIYLGQGGTWVGVGNCALEYGAFVSLTAALFIISAGVYVGGDWNGRSWGNTMLMAVGALLANVVGSVGASLILLRPLLRSNRNRVQRAHTIVFFIFVVGNCGGLLTAFGNPPLTLGFFRGVPFFWTLRLAPEWLFVNGGLLALYFVLDRCHFVKEKGLRGLGPGFTSAASDPAFHLDVRGWMNLLLLGLVLVLVSAVSFVVEPFLVRWLGATDSAHSACLGFQVFCLVGISVFSWRFTNVRLRDLNRFDAAPLWEFATIFLGIFGALLPALALLGSKAGAFAPTSSVGYFWSSGMVSSVLDNAPTYLVFAALATSKAGLRASDLGSLAVRFPGWLGALSCGAVMMGALTYIGNAPNWLVKGVAEGEGVAMPSFVRYVGWSCLVLLPLFLLLSFVFFR